METKLFRCMSHPKAMANIELLRHKKTGGVKNTASEDRNDYLPKGLHIFILPSSVHATDADRFLWIHVLLWTAEQVVLIRLSEAGEPRHTLSGAIQPKVRHLRHHLPNLTFSYLR